MGFEYAKVDSNVSSTMRITMGVIIMTLSWTILPLSIFYVYHYNRLRHANILKKRYVGLGVTSSILLMIWVGIINQLYILQNMFAHILSPLTITILKAIYVAIYPYTSHCSLWLILTRFWMTYFDFSWTKATLNAEWKIHIDPKGSSKTEHWFLNHKTKYGNLQMIRRKAWIISLCIASISSLLFEISVFSTLFKATHVQIFDGLCFIAPAVTLLIIWKKIPSVYDIMFYRDEMKRLGFSALFTLTNYFGIIAVNLMFGDDVLSTLYGSLMVIFHCFSIILFQSMWVLYKIKKSRMNLGRQYIGEHSLILSQSSSYPQTTFRMQSYSTNHHHHHHKHDDHHKDRDKASMLPSILSNKHAFNLFMQHLSAEFSMECLLSFVEFTQFRMLLKSDKAFMAKIPKEDDDDDDNDNDDEKKEEKDTNTKNPEHDNNNNNNNNNNDKNKQHKSNDTTELEKMWTDINMIHNTSNDNDAADLAIIDANTPNGVDSVTPNIVLTPTTPTTPIHTFPVIAETMNVRKKQRKHRYETVKLPLDIPQSIIVYSNNNNNTIVSYLKIANDLYMKYVKIGSEMEINVSYGMRYGVQHLLTNSYDNNGNIKDNIHKDLYYLFENCRKELYVLMTHSCQRFVDSEAYNTVQHELLN